MFRDNRSSQGGAKYTPPVHHQHCRSELHALILRLQSFIHPLQLTVNARRAALRRGEDPDVPVPLQGPQKGVLISVPLFHVTGSTSLAVRVKLNLVSALEAYFNNVDARDG